MFCYRGDLCVRILAELLPAAGEPVEAVRKNYAYWEKAGHILREDDIKYFFYFKKVFVFGGHGCPQPFSLHTCPLFAIT